MSRLLPPPFGPFHPLRRLGAGGMAETFVAVRRGPGGFSQNVCIKRILPAFESDAEFVESFLQEARMSAALRHANIVQVMDFGVADDSHYLALELIDGLDLRALLGGDSDQRVLLEPDLITLIAADVGAALEHAHSDAPGRPSVVHRDVSPSNVLISTAGEVKLTDFGIARATSGRGRTATGIIKGKVPYMPPEYIDHSMFDPRGDLFSLGVMLYEAMAGQRPFDGHSDIDTIRRIVAGQHTHLGALALSAPPHLVQCVERLLAVRPDDRYPSARAFQEALPAVASHRVRRRLGDLVRQRMQELNLVLDAPSAPPDEPRRQSSPSSTGAAFSPSAAAHAQYVPDSRIDRLPRTHTRDPVRLSEPSTDTRARRNGPSSRALWTLASSGALLAVVIGLVLLRGPDAPPKASRSSESAPKPAEIPAPNEPGTSLAADSDWPPPSAPGPHNANPDDPGRVVSAGGIEASADTPRDRPPDALYAAPPVSDSRGEPSPTSDARRSSKPRERSTRATPHLSTSQEPNLGQLAELKIFVSPFGDVWVDGKRLGQAPVTIKLEAGSHEVAVGDGRPKERRTIELAPGQRERLEITRRDVSDSNE